MGSEPLISVCIPSYNNEKFIAATLESLLKQTYRNFEILVTDDCSTDGTLSVISKFSDPRIHVTKNERNLGIGRNWQKALSAATGKYVKLLCGDDILYPDCLRSQVAALENPAHSSVTLAICNCDVINSRDEVVLHRGSHLRRGQIEGGRVIRQCIRFGSNLLGEPAVGLFRRNIADLSNTFDFDNPYMVDMDLWAELLRRGDVFVDHTHLAAFRISASSVTATLGRRQAAYFRRFIQKIRANPAYHVNGSDAFFGYFLSFQWAILRNLFINFKR